MPSRFRGDTMNESLQLAPQLPSSIPSMAGASGAKIPGASGGGATSPLRRGTDAIRNTLQSLQATTPLAPLPQAPMAAPLPEPKAASPTMPGVNINLGGGGAGGGDQLQEILRQLIRFDPRELMPQQVATSPSMPMPAPIPQRATLPVVNLPPQQQVATSPSMPSAPPANEEQQLIARLNQIRQGRLQGGGMRGGGGRPASRLLSNARRQGPRPAPRPAASQTTRRAARPTPRPAARQQTRPSGSGINRARLEALRARRAARRR